FVSCDTLLLSVGLIPENELSRGAEIPLSPVTSGPLVDENRMTQKEGIFACGNVLQVHDLVDYVSEEAALAGRSAADYVLGRLSFGEPMEVEAGEGIRYVVPQRICGKSGEEVSLFFRVREPKKNVALCAYYGDTCCKRVRRIAVAPGEMERISLRIPSREKENTALRVVLEEVEA
ncbi:MAG: pyridine nucleotide-disulfide oxidoreductase, partial [Clostridia bacterium]|nr:pyridine nucleotide-disulfide oxidoreductase [Clostridia bacterium]